jgi:hypothetical protein
MESRTHQSNSMCLSSRPTASQVAARFPVSLMALAIRSHWELAVGRELLGHIEFLPTRRQLLAEALQHPSGLGGQRSESLQMPTWRSRYGNRRLEMRARLQIVNGLQGPARDQMSTGGITGTGRRPLATDRAPTTSVEPDSPCQRPNRDRVDPRSRPLPDIFRSTTQAFRRRLVGCGVHRKYCGRFRNRCSPDRHVCSCRHARPAPGTRRHPPAPGLAGTRLMC